MAVRYRRLGEFEGVSDQVTYLTGRGCHVDLHLTGGNLIAGKYLIQRLDGADGDLARLKCGNQRLCWDLCNGRL